MLIRIDEHAPQLAADCWVAPNATLIGSVKIGSRASVWFGAMLRADSTSIILEDEANVQDNAVVHGDDGFPVRIGRGATIGHSAVIHGCTIGAQSLIGMGAVIMNGARVGARCIVAARALVPENMVIPDGSLVIGMPARIKGSLSDTQQASLDRAQREYVDRAERYRARAVVLIEGMAQTKDFKAP